MGDPLDVRELPFVPILQTHGTRRNQFPNFQLFAGRSPLVWYHGATY